MTEPLPAIASKYRVSRQHVQVTANQLLARGLLRAVPNPVHKRSPLFRLSDEGRETFAEVRRNETAIINKMFADPRLEDVEVTRQTLRSLLGRCESGELLWRYSV